MNLFQISVTKKKKKCCFGPINIQHGTDFSPSHLTLAPAACLYDIAVSFKFNYILLNIQNPYPVISLSGSTHSSQTHSHMPRRASCFPTTGYDCERCPCVCVCVCSCVPLILVLPVPGMWRFVWRVSHTLCYQHLCDEHKHSLRGLGWGSVTDGTVSGSPSVVLKALLLSLATRILSPCAAKVPSFLTQGKGRPHLTTAPATHVPSCCCCFFFLSLSFSSTLLNYGNRCCFAQTLT